MEDVKKLYILAYDLGCKGITYFRDGSRDAAVLYSKDVKQTDEPEKVAILPEDNQAALKINVTPKPRPEVVSGSTYKIRTGYGTLFVTVNNDEDGKPFEVFAAIGKTGGFFAAKSEAICRLISLALRCGIDVEEIIGQLKGIRGPMPSWGRYGQVLSIPDAISHVLREHINSAQQKLRLEFKKEKTEQAFLDENKIKELPAAEIDASVAQELHNVAYGKVAANIADRGVAPECPECHGILELVEGCMLCRGCGYSKCA
jgi:ribonucleoside-diphosphate reductase alpha chain